MADNDVTMTEEQEQPDENYEDEEFEDDVEYEEVIEEVVEEVVVDADDNENIEEDQNIEAQDGDFEDGDFDDGDFDDGGDDEFDDGDDGWNDGGDGGWGDGDDVADINNDDNIMSGAKQNQFESTIPEMTDSSINSNCDEINMIPLFAATPDLKSRSRIGAMVGIRVANLTNITTDQLEVWGLTPEFPFIALKLMCIYIIICNM